MQGIKKNYFDIRYSLFDIRHSKRYMLPGNVSLPDSYPLQEQLPSS